MVNSIGINRTLVAVLICRLIQKRSEYLGVMHGGAHHRVGLHQFVGFVRVDVVLVAVLSLDVLLRSAGIQSLASTQIS